MKCEVVIVMADCSHHQPIGFLPLSFSFSDDHQDQGGSLRSSSGSVNDLLDLMMEEEEEEEGDGEKDCDQTWCESFQKEEVTTRSCIDNKMNVERSEIRANDNFSSKEQRSHVNTFGNSVQLSSQACFDVDNDEGETTGIINTWLQLRTVNLPPGHQAMSLNSVQDQYHHHHRGQGGFLHLIMSGLTQISVVYYKSH